MKTKEVALAVEEWAASVSAANSYPEPPRELIKALPLVIAEVTRKQRVVTGSKGGFQQTAYQQTAGRLWTLKLMVLVDREPEWTASQALYDIVDDIEEAFASDKTLGGRVGFADPNVDTSFDPAEVEYADGTVARAATMTLTIGEQTEV